MAKALLSAEEFAAVEAAVRAAEARTTGEIYCAVAEESADYHATPLAWAAGVALLAPAVLLMAGLHRGEAAGQAIGGVDPHEHPLGLVIEGHHRAGDGARQGELAEGLAGEAVEHLQHLVAGAGEEQAAAHGHRPRHRAADRGLPGLVDPPPIVPPPPIIPPPPLRHSRLRLRVNSLEIGKTANLQPYLFKVLAQQDPAAAVDLMITVRSEAGISGETLDSRIVEGLEQLGIAVEWDAGG